MGEWETYSMQGWGTMKGFKWKLFLHGHPLEWAPWHKHHFVLTRRHTDKKKAIKKIDRYAITSYHLLLVITHLFHQCFPLSSVPRTPTGTPASSLALPAPKAISAAMTTTPHDVSGSPLTHQEFSEVTYTKKRTLSKHITSQSTHFNMHFHFYKWVKFLCSSPLYQLIWIQYGSSTNITHLA